jgi:general secretion pathway protein D
VPQLFRRLTLLTLLGVSWPLPHRAFAHAAPADGNERLITMDFQEVDIMVLVKFMSELTGKNFILDERVRGKVTLFSPTRMSMDDAYAAFQSALQMNGLTTVPAGAVIKILPTKDAKSSSIRTVAPDERE